MNYDLGCLPQNYHWPAAYLLNLIHWKTCCWKAEATGCVRLKWDYLTNAIPADLCPKLVFHYLNGKSGLPPVLETIGGEPGKCRGYRLTESYRKVRRIVCTDTVMNERIWQLRQRENQGKQSVHVHLERNLDLLDFDYERSQAIISTLVPDLDSPMPVSEFQELLDGQCQRLRDKEHRLTVCRYGRVHTLVSNLPKELRCCLSVNGEKLTGWDLANSQPLMCCLLCERYYRDRKARQRMINQTYEEGGDPYHAPNQAYRRRSTTIPRSTSPNSNNNLPNTQPHSITPPTTNNIHQHPAYYDELDSLSDYENRELGRGGPGTLYDFQRFKEVCEAGRFYESFGVDRERAKKSMFPILFGPIKYGGKAKAAFEDRFPSVAKVLRAMKEKNYACVAWSLQNLESMVFIKRICGDRIMAERPDIPIFTVHDCLFTVAKHMSYIRRVIKDEFAQLGLCPTLRRIET